MDLNKDDLAWPLLNTRSTFSYALSEWERNAMQPSMHKKQMETKLYTSITRFDLNVLKTSWCISVPTPPPLGKNSPSNFYDRREVWKWIFPVGAREAMEKDVYRTLKHMLYWTTLCIAFIIISTSNTVYF